VAISLVNDTRDAVLPVGYERRVRVLFSCMPWAMGTPDGVAAAVEDLVTRG